MEENIINYFKEVGWYDKFLHTKTVINQSDMDQEDAVFILEIFFQKFNIVNPQDFDIDKLLYHRSFVSHIKTMFGFAIVEEEKPKITIEHMIKVADKREWFLPVDS